MQGRVRIRASVRVGVRVKVYLWPIFFYIYMKEI